MSRPRQGLLGPYKRALIYTRVSTKDQVDNQSLDTQERQCRALCAREGLEVVAVFREEGESAKTVLRTELRRLLAFASTRANRIDHVVFYAVDRFTRKAEDFHAVRGMLRGLGVTPKYVLQPVDDSPTGRLVEGISAQVAQFDNDLKAERTRDAMRDAARDGRWLWRAPIGYFNGPVKREPPSLVPDPERAPHVRRAFELMASGSYEKVELHAVLTREGFRDERGRPIAMQTFDKMLRNPLYAGRVVLPHMEVDAAGDFEPLVAADLFDLVQAILTGRRVAPLTRVSDDARLPFRRFLRCAHCGTPATGSFSTGRHGTRHAYYRCRGPRGRKCPGFNTAAGKVEEKFLALLRSLQPRREYLRAFKAVVLETWSSRRDTAADDAARHRKTIEELTAKKARYVEAVVEGRIAKREYDVAIEDVQRRIDEARLAEHEAREREVDVAELLAFAERVLTDLGALWMRLDAKGRRALQATVFPAGLTFDGEVFGTPQIASVFLHLRAVGAPGSGEASPEGFEPS